MKHPVQFEILLVVAVFIFLGSSKEAHGDEIGRMVEQPVAEAIVTRQQTQLEDKQWRQLQQQLMSEMEQLQSSIGHLQATKNELTAANTAAMKRIEDKRHKLESIRQIKEQMEPFLVQLVAEIGKLPDSGLPFLFQERAERITKLETALYDPETALSEKFRLAMETLQVEMEYGLTIETYQQQIDLGTENILVNIFRLGRLGLYFQTLDQQRCGAYDLGKKQWVYLPDSYNFNMQKVIEIAAKRRPAELVAIPLGRLTRMVQQ